jgi:hypothetical protein
MVDGADETFKNLKRLTASIVARTQASVVSHDA